MQINKGTQNELNLEADPRYHYCVFKEGDYDPLAYLSPWPGKQVAKIGFQDGGFVFSHSFNLEGFTPKDYRRHTFCQPIDSIDHVLDFLGEGFVVVEYYEYENGEALHQGRIVPLAS